MNQERPDVIVKRKRLQTLDDAFAISEYDCRVFKEILSFRSFCNSPAFLEEKSTDVQIVTFYCLSRVCRKNDYRPV